jgi:hypothetical protein
MLRWPPPMIWPAFMPTDVSRALFDPGYLKYFAETVPQTPWRSLTLDSVDWREFWSTVMVGFSVAVYTTLGTVLTWASVRRFETAAGRPSRPSRSHPLAGNPGQSQDGDPLDEALPVAAAAD